MLVSTFVQGTISQKIFDNCLNPVMLVFIGKLFSNKFVLSKLATSGVRSFCFDRNWQEGLNDIANFESSQDIFKCYEHNWENSVLLLSRAALTTHELEWLEHWGRRAELELKSSTRELVYFWNTNVTQNI